MKIRELMEILEEQDPDAEVLIMGQARWRFENGIHGVTVRSEIEESDDDDGMPVDRRPDGRAANDVFIVEGKQLRYGSKTAWDVATR
jgi:hypothetical protein